MMISIQTLCFAIAVNNPGDESEQREREKKCMFFYTSIQAIQNH